MHAVRSFAFLIVICAVTLVTAAGGSTPLIDAVNNKFTIIQGVPYDRPRTTMSASACRSMYSSAAAWAMGRTVVDPSSTSFVPVVRVPQASTDAARKTEKNRRIGCIRPPGGISPPLPLFHYTILAQQVKTGKMSGHDAAVCRGKAAYCRDRKYDRYGKDAMSSRGWIRDGAKRKPSRL
jgi:hypothetical protein